ncbi:unnamed protein product, partial [Polarella glacialis]
DGIERLATPFGHAGGLSPCGLEGVVEPEVWTIETLVSCAGDDSVAFSVFAEAKSGGAPVAARVLVALWPDRLTFTLEVAHEGGDDETAEVEDATMQ